MNFKISLFLLIFIIPLVSFSQSKKDQELELYVPHNLESFEKYPLKTINIKIHVIHFSEENPMNPTLKDTAMLKRVINEDLNLMYSNFKPCTLKSEKPAKLIYDSRMRFHLANIQFHIDPELISSEYYLEGDKNGAPWGVDLVDLINNELVVNRNTYNLVKEKPKGMDSIVVYDFDGNRSILNFDTVYYSSSQTRIKVRQSLKGLSIEKVNYIYKKSTICDPDLFKKYAYNDSSYLHIFLTNSFNSQTMGGCGPSPLFMKVGNLKYGNGVTRLIGHEIGHCMGLYHTDYPQFSDLPKKDKLCSTCYCDSTTISNNIMGYNFCRNYLSPFQIAHIQKEYNNVTAKINTTTDAYYTRGRTLKFTNDSIKRNIAFGGDVIIKKKRTTVLTGTLYLPEGASIYVEKKAKLIIDGGKVTNMVGSNWEGIQYVKKYKSNKEKIKPIKENISYLETKNGGVLEKVKQK